MGQVGLFVMVEATKVQNMVHRQPTTMNTTTICCAIPRQSMAAIMTLLSCDCEFVSYACILEPLWNDDLNMGESAPILGRIMTLSVLTLMNRDRETYYGNEECRVN